MSRVTAFLFRFSPEAGNRDGHFVDIKRCENTIFLKCWQHRVLVVYPHDLMADCERGSLSLPCITGDIMQHIAGLRNDQNSKFEV